MKCNRFLRVNYFCLFLSKYNFFIFSPHFNFVFMIVQTKYCKFFNILWIFPDWMYVKMRVKIVVLSLPDKKILILIHKINNSHMKKRTKTNKTAIGTFGRRKQKLLIFEKKKCYNVFVYLPIHSFIYSFMVSSRCILELLEVWIKSHCLY